MIDGGTFLLLLRMVVSLAIVLGLVVLFARWLERRGVGGVSVRRPGRPAATVEGASGPAAQAGPGSGASGDGPAGRSARRRSRRPRSRAAAALPRLLPARRPEPVVTAEVLARAHLSRAASVQVVRVGGRVLALGVTDHAVAVLAHLDRADLEGEGAAVATEDGPARPSRTAAPGSGDTVGAAAVDQGRAVDARAIEIFEHMLHREGRHRGGPVAPQDERRG